MTPTNQLRFVLREVREEIIGTPYSRVESVRVLQQWWRVSPDHDPKMGEWRDVPVEVE